MNKYFAAANGYTGFRSYFDIIFNPIYYNKIYVIKGGPGTGKSSLMKKISSEFSIYERDEIYCSSDLNSLDGVIIKYKNKKIAILDGTAPHERDAKIPGVIDKIINVGDFWDEAALKDKTDEIINLNKNKSNHYKNAYKLLMLAGKIDFEIEEITRNAYSASDNEMLSTFLCKGENKQRLIMPQLISCFGKYGYKLIDKANLEGKTNYTVKGRFGSEFIFMEKLKKLLDLFCVNYTYSPSPFSDKKIEAIKIFETDTLVTTAYNFENILDTREFLSEEIINENKKLLELYSTEKAKLLEYSSNEFESASNIHFELEGIYSKSMNFNMLNIVTNNLITEIKEALQG